MKILLIQAYTVLDEPPIFPLGLAYLAAMLTEHEIKVFDMNIVEEPLPKIETMIKDFSPDVIGYSMRNMKLVMPGVHFSCFKPHQDAIQWIKKVSPHIPIIAGGSAFSLYAEEIMSKVPEIDMGVFGEGEITFKELLNNIKNPENVKSVYYRTNGSLVFTGYRERPDFKDLPMPRRDIVDISQYKHPTAIGVETTRGCAFRCIYCSDLYLLGGTVRTRNAKSVVDEIEYLIKNYGVKNIMFADQVFNLPAKHAKEICEEIIRRKIDIQWTAWFTPLGIDEEIVILAKKAGCVVFNFSPESVDDDVLKKMKKGISYKDIEKINKIAKKFNVPVAYNFMLNLPGETLRSIIKLLWFVLKTKIKMGRLFRPHGNFVVPVRIYPHTELQEISIQEGVIEKTDDLIEARFYSPKSMVKYLGQFILDIFVWLWRVKNFNRSIFHKRVVKKFGG
ncbi:MAG: radical SAM protein [Nitrospirota bacterium]